MSFNRSFSHINFTFLNITMTPIPHVGKKHVFVPIAPVNVSVSLINIEQNGHTWCHCATVINRPFVNICSDERTSYITDFTGSVWMESKLGPFSTTGKSSWHRRQYMTIWPDRFKTGLCSVSWPLFLKLAVAALRGCYGTWNVIFCGPTWPKVLCRIALGLLIRYNLKRDSVQFLCIIDWPSNGKVSHACYIYSYSLQQS